MITLRSAALAALASVALPLGPAPDSARGEAVGGRYFLCGAFQAVKYISLATGQVEGVVVGAIGSGLACGFGW
jgi:hypothetical protein